MFALAFVLVCYAFDSVQSLRSCTPTDYVISGSRLCDPNTHLRAVFYSRKSSMSTTSFESDCIGPDLITSQQSCQCHMSEYLPTLDKCNTTSNEQPITGWSSTNSCDADKTVMNQFSGGYVPCECQVEDIGSAFTECNEARGSRHLVFYWRRECTVKSVTLPMSVRIGCRDECDWGQYFGPPHSNCTNCPSGTFAIPGDVYSPPWTSWPRNFHTSCVGDKCQPWRVHNDSIDSGDQGSMDYAVTSLKMWVDVVTAPAILTVTFRTSSEMHGDFFVIYVNSRLAFARSGEMPMWETATIDLHEAGAPDCKWTIKDSFPGNVLQNKSCAIRNSFEPYRQALHFDAHQSPFSYPAAYAKNEGCSPSDYGPEVRNKLVFIKRGTCFFIQKIENAQNAGAAAVVVVNNVRDPLTVHMYGDGSNVTIPSVFVSQEDGENVMDTLKLGNGVTITVERESVEMGRVEVDFVYQKDFSETKGQDRVWIQSLQVTGTKYAAESCTKCPPGSTSMEGSSKCIPCPANTYAKDYGTPFPCIPCPPHHMSGPGATACMATTACTQDDYYPVFSKCANGRRTLSFTLIDPPMCDVKNSTFTPSTQDVSCVPCASTRIRPADNGECVACPQGQVPNRLTIGSEAKSCTPCSLGSIAEKRLEYSGFDDLHGVLPSTWTMTCDQCSGNAWSFTPQKMTSIFGASGLTVTALSTGRGLGDSTLVTLSIPIQMEVTGTVTFSYMFTMDDTYPNDLDAIRGHFRVFRYRIGGDEVYASILDRDAGYHVSESNDLKPGKYVLEFSYGKHRYTFKPVIFSLLTLIISGEASGDAVACTPCPLGYMCKNGIPERCPPGTSSNLMNSTACTPCPMFEVSYGYGSTSCELCGYATLPDSHGRACYLISDAFIPFNPDAFASPLVRYNFESFVSHPLGPYDIPNNVSSEIVGPRLFTQRKLFLCLRPRPDDQLPSGWPHCGWQGNEVGPVAYIQQGDNQTLVGRNVFVNAKRRNGTYLGRMETHNDMTDILISLTHGDICDNGLSTRYETHLKLVCSVIYETPLVEVERPDGCKIMATLRSRYACPKCDKKLHFTSSTSPCQQSKRWRYYTYNSSLGEPNCFGGDVMPDPIQEACPWALEMEEKHPEMIIGLMITVTVLIVVCAVGIAYLYVSRRKLYAQYTSLSTNLQGGTVPHEMSDFDSHNETDHPGGNEDAMDDP